MTETEISDGIKHKCMEKSTLCQSVGHPVNEMKILHVVVGLQKASGVTTFVKNLVVELRAMGHVADVVTRASALSAKRQFLADLKAYDLVHIHGLWDPWLHRWARAARKTGVTIVWSPHGMLTPWAVHYKWLKKKIAWRLYQKKDLQRTAALHVTMPSEEDDVRRMGLKNPVIGVPLGVRMPDLTPRDIAIQGRVVLFVGRVAQIKALPHLVGAMVMSNGWRLRIVGPDQEGHTEELKALAEQEGVAGRIDFVGVKYGVELTQEYLNADCFVLPSFSENFGSVVVEAMAAGLPVIASTGTPWQELVERKCGWWVANDPETLARTILEMMALTDEERRAMGARGRKLVEEKYQWPAIGRQMAMEYRRLMSRVELSR